MSDGLKHKYNVTRVSTGETVTDCFVLKPDSDPHARAALVAYADSCKDELPELSEDLMKWALHSWAGAR